MLKSLLYVGLGGFIGSMARYAIYLLIGTRWSLIFPWGTFTVNILGSLLIGILIGLSYRGGLLSDSLRLFLITGFCGGFTTFSTFSMEGMNLLQQGHTSQFVSYSMGSVVLGIAAVFIGFQLSR